MLIYVFCILLATVAGGDQGGPQPKPMTDTLLHDMMSSVPESVDQKMTHIKERLETLSNSGKGISVLLPFLTTMLNEAYGVVDKHVTKPLANAIVCTVCKSAMLSVQFGIAAGQNEEQLLMMVKNLMCDYLQVFSDEICSQYLLLAGPPLLHILNQTELPPEVVCSLVIPTHCQAPLPEELKWTIDIPAPASPAKSQISYPKDGKKVLKVLHLSDTHIDDKYVEGSWDECRTPQCCREPRPSNDSARAGKYGGWHCDIPAITLEALLDFAVNNITEIDHVIWTGDIPAHDLWNQSEAHNLEMINRTIATVHKYFPGEGVVLPCIGNHEPVPGNLLPTPKISSENSNFSTAWLYDSLAQHWTADWLTIDKSATIKYGGFYKTYYRPGLLMVSINSVFCYSNNWWLVLDSVDPGDELSWLVGVLQEAEQQGEKVHIIAHVPPGNVECLSQWRANYYRIMHRYKDTVVAQFFGHTHNDEFALVPDPDDVTKSSSVMMIGPSVTTYTYLNPGFRIYYVDGDHDNTTRKVIDYESWIMDLEESNRLERPIWKLLYTAREAYGLESMEPDQWRTVYEGIQQHDDLLQQYHRYYWKDSPKRPDCDETCRQNYLSNIIPNN